MDAFHKLHAHISGHIQAPTYGSQTNVTMGIRAIRWNAYLMLRMDAADELMGQGDMCRLQAERTG